MSCALWVTVITYMVLSIFSLYLVGAFLYVVFLMGDPTLKGILEVIFAVPAFLLCAALCFGKGFSLITEEKRRRQQVEFDRQSSVYE